MLPIERFYMNWYGKEKTKPGRKMGHITIVGESFPEIIQNIEIAKENIKIVADDL